MGRGGLKDSCQLDRIEGYEQNLKEKSSPLFQFFGWKLCPLYLDKLTFHHFPRCFLINYEHRGQSYSTLHHKNFSTALIHMCHNTKVDMHKYFRSKLSHFVSEIRRTILQDIKNRSDKFEVGNSPLFFPMYRLMCDTMYYFPKPESFFFSYFLNM